MGQTATHLEVLPVAHESDPAYLDNPSFGYLDPLCSFPRATILGRSSVGLAWNVWVPHLFQSMMLEITLFVMDQNRKEALGRKHRNEVLHYRLLQQQHLHC